MQNIHLFAEYKKTELRVFDNLEKSEIKSLTEMGSAVRLNHGAHRQVIAISDLNPDSLYSASKHLVTGDPLPLFKHWEPKQEKAFEDDLTDEIDKWNHHMNHLALHFSPEVISTRAYWKSVKQHVWFFATEVGLREDIRPCFMLELEVLARQNKKTTKSSVTKSWISPKYVNQVELEKLVLYAAESALDKLNAKPFHSGAYSLVLGPLAAPGIFHEVVGHGLEADIAALTGAAFHNSKGERIGSDKLTIVDDPTSLGLPGSYNIDDEGITAKCTTLVEEGRISNYLSHLHSKVQSNGHGRVINYAHPPLVRMSNTFVLPGEDEPEEIILETKSGIYIKNAFNGDVNMITGEFKIHVTEGYLIENGKLTTPITPSILKGDGRKLLRSIDRVGNDFQIHAEVRGGCGKLGQSPLPVSAGSPTVRVLDWEVQAIDS
ncbi:TldD/PmbA family protein [Paenibacillus sp. W2I17]|uniref:TldD/PmbA family protein n=1 Tax=Paenibacillus sp. W2I17 TaxID=3042311 RepID=UPI0027873A70|nr:TldD/PmbA family protein [Paenibacillus sp. W2I17]MDQ0656017.1 TldD protein [Paenibacillus sp. W2I17]